MQAHLPSDLELTPQPLLSEMPVGAGGWTVWISMFADNDGAMWLHDDAKLSHWSNSTTIYIERKADGWHVALCGQGPWMRGPLPPNSVPVAAIHRGCRV